jgi:uncharacterized protein YkwD
MRFTLTTLALFAAASVSAAVAPGNSTVLLCKINFIRNKYKLEPLGQSDKLNKAAAGHAQDEAKMNRVTTTGSDGSDAGRRAERAGFNYQNLGELVGGGYRNEDELLKNFMADGRIRDYILNKDFEMFGSGFARGNRDYPYWDLMFGTDWIGKDNVPDCKDVAPVPADLEMFADDEEDVESAVGPILTRNQ